VTSCSAQSRLIWLTMIFRGGPALPKLRRSARYLRVTKCRACGLHRSELVSEIVPASRCAAKARSKVPDQRLSGYLSLDVSFGSPGPYAVPRPANGLSQPGCPPPEGRPPSLPHLPAPFLNRPTSRG